MSGSLRRGGASAQVPIQTILATIALVVATYLAWLVIQRIANVLELIGIALFFALVLNPLVDALERRLHRRALAAGIVFLAGIGLFSGLLYLFIQPLVSQVQTFIESFPEFVADARDGKGPVGDIVTRYNLDQYVQENQDRFRATLTNSAGSVAAIFRVVASGVASLLTVLVLAFLMLLSGRSMLRAPLVFFDPPNQERIRKVAADAAKAVTGYTAGNLLISVIAGTVTFIALITQGVPYAAVLAVWVAFADLIPLIGATMGAIPTIGVAFLHSIRSGVVMFIVYVIYQQIENHFIQTAVMSRTVNLNPLAVLVSVLIGVDLAGLLGALLAIPIAGVIQVVGRDLFDHRHHRLKGEVTIGADEIPIDTPSANPGDDVAKSGAPEPERLGDEVAKSGTPEEES